MKTLRPVLSILLILSLSACAQLHVPPLNPTANAIDNTAPVPAGTYFIVNDSGMALTPNNSTVGENVFLQRFTKSGAQKWELTIHKTSKGDTYTIRLAGTDNLYFQPYYVKNHTPIIAAAGNTNSFKIVAAEGPKTWYIKSILYNGDALRSFVFSPNLPTETRFEAPENTGKFLWKLIPAGSN